MGDANRTAPQFSPESYPLLDQIQRSGNIKQLDIWQLSELAQELRQSLIEVVQHTGGHLASNLGVVELTIALHYVFDSPEDAFLWDVGHQAYAHKMLTGRWRDFATLRQRAGLYGFPRRSESLHDYLNAGHAGTAISVGLGLELGRRLSSQEGHHGGNKVLCVVGDAALTSGIAFEAMNHCGHEPNHLVVILNDNEMSISPNVGAISRVLSRLTAGYSYVFIRDHINQFIRKIPLLGAPAYRFLLRLKGAVKKAVYRTNLFTEFGFKYVGPIYGHDIPLLIDTFQRVQHLNEPVFLHISTQKGKGLKEAEEAPTKYHGVTPKQKKSQLGVDVSFTQSFTASLMDLEASYGNLVCISAAMTGSTGLQVFAALHPERFFDVGIAEQHALALACGLAMTGQIPLIAIYSTFMQRAMDQLIHDVSLMHLPVIFVCDRAGIVPGDGDTHQGIYDIAQFRSIIGLELYSPGTQQQVYACLSHVLQSSQASVAEWRESVQCGQHEFAAKPAIIRLPKRSCPDAAILPKSETSISCAYFPTSAHSPTLLEDAGQKILLICTGSLLPEALALQERLARQECLVSSYLELDILQLCQIAPLPELKEYLENGYAAIYCIEDGVQQGGVGEEILASYTGGSCPVFLRGVKEQVPQLGNYGELLEDYGMDAVSLEAWILQSRELEH